MKKVKIIINAILVIAGMIFLGLAPAGEKAFALKWGDLGVRMMQAGVIDENKFPNFYNDRNLVINSENSHAVLNTLWALGLSNKNPILGKGPMADPRYGGAGNFASTGGWTLSAGSAMSHYGMHSFITLTPEQQALVEKIAKNIYRPCCDNPAYFPDCNHGMAMLGLLELMASQGASEQDMYKTALQANALWFPGQYETIKNLFASQNIDWNTADPIKILSAEFSSASGYRKVQSLTQPQENKGGSDCSA